MINKILKDWMQRAGEEEIKTRNWAIKGTATTCLS